MPRWNNPNCGFQKGHSNFSKEWNKKEKGLRLSPKSEFKKGNTPWNKGKPWTNKHKKSLRKSWTLERKEKYRQTWLQKAKNKKKTIIWKNTIEYKNWRKAVFERDNYICQMCKQRGGQLNADHIKPQSLFPELRFDINNGRTLCRKCHKKTDTWGNRVRKLQVFV